MGINKYFFILLPIILLLISCQSTLPVNPTKHTASYEGILQYKKDIGHQFISGIYPLTIKDTTFQSISEWYDDKHILYVKTKNNHYIIQKYSLFNGTDSLFYKSVNPIMYVKANAHHSLFAIYMTNFLNESSIVVLNKSGSIVYNWEGSSYDVQFMWNPYQANELMVTTFQPNWDFMSFVINLDDKTSKFIQIDHPYMQWVDKDTVGYLGWGDEPQHHAPLYLANLQDMKVEKWKENVIAFFSFKGVLLVIQPNSSAKNFSSYLFYDTNSNKRLKQITLPLVDTYSEFWWIPQHDYHHGTKSFYTILKKHHVGMDSNFQLVKYSLNNRDMEFITNVEGDVPINISPNGEYGLIGNRFEQLVNFENNNIVHLLEAN